MQKKIEKYARTILTTCLKIEKNQPLLISANYERRDFVRVLANIAFELGVKDIYFDLTDVDLKHDCLAALELEDLKKLSFWNKGIWNEYAKKGAAFVMLVSETPGLMKDIDPKKLSDLTIHSLESRKEFDDLRDKAMVPWCIAAVPTEKWANQVFKNDEDSLNKLWEAIFKICHINSHDPEQKLNNHIEELTTRTKLLNKYRFKKLKYTNNLGTDFEIELPDTHLWCSGKSVLKNKKEVLVNYPTFEVFTSPTNDSANGIVYSSKPLAYQDNIIEDFWIKFKDGIAIECGAKKGKEVLENIISSCKNSNRLGEVALVETKSPISESDITFYETLFDENASCHLALGAAFPECVTNGEEMSREELDKLKLNDCTNHVDFMIGTPDLTITGITEKDEEITIFENGNFSLNFQK